MIQDLFSNWVEAFPIKGKDAQHVAHLIVNEVFCRFGSPRQILSHCGKEFDNLIMAEILSVALTSVRAATTPGLTAKCSDSTRRSCPRSDISSTSRLKTGTCASCKYSSPTKRHIIRPSNHRPSNCSSAVSLAHRSPLSFSLINPHTDLHIMPLKS